MSYQRLYPQRINWEDEPSLATPINQVNLNKMDSALYGIDGRVVELDENKVGKSDTFNTSRNGVVPKPTQADITNEKVLRADGSWVEQSGGGGGGGGHTIVNNAGTSLTQRGKLKTVGGLNATDDGVNNTTEITDVVEEVPWATWQSYPNEEAALQAHPNCVVTGAPDCDGDIEIEFEKVLWTNENPTSAFGAGQITLNSSDYTDYEVRFAQNKNSTSSRISSRTEKGKGTLLNYSAATESGVRTFSRGVAYVDATHLSIADCTYATGTTADVTNNDNCIPIEVIGHKRKLTAKIQAIARNVSTEASKCMLDENTSVKDAIGNVNGWTLAGNVTSTSLVAISVPATAKEILAVLLNPSNVVLISQVIPRDLMSSGASLKDVANTSKELYSNGSKWKVTDATYTGKIYYRN